MLRLQAEAVALVVHGPALALNAAVQKVAGIELKPRLGCQHFHRTTRLRLRHPRCEFEAAAGAAHVGGDVTIGMVLDAYERVLKLWPHPDRRHRIEHCTLVTPDLLRRLKATGSIPTPFWTYVYYHGEKWGAYGDDRMRWMFAHRSFLDSGIPVPGASDYGPGPFEPLMAIQSMVTRRDYRGREWGPNQKVSVDEALKIATINGAYASYEETSKGSLTGGKLADFVMLEADPHTVPPDEIMKIKVARTVVGGKTMHS